MIDFDRREVMCWHGVKLYECTNPEHTTPKATASSRNHFSRETVVYYHGTGEFSVTITDRDSDMFGGGTIHQVGPCKHRHTTIEAAEICGNRMTERAVREWNKARGIK